MKKFLKKLFLVAAASTVLAASVSLSGCSYLVYTIWDNQRVNEILAQLQKEKDEANKPHEESNYHRQAYAIQSVEETGDKTVRTYQMLTLVDETTYALDYYDRVSVGESSYTAKYYHTEGEYTREGNVVTVKPGVGSLSECKDAGTTYVYTNGQTEDARTAMYEAVFGSNQSIALMKDGSFRVGGTSDSSEELTAPNGARVFRYTDTASRPTYRTLALFPDGVYIVTNHSLHSQTPDLTVGSFIAIGRYDVDEEDVDANIEGQEGEHTYDLVTLSAGRGFNYANNNGSDMMFDLQSDASFQQWYQLSVGSSTQLTVSETGYTYLVGVREVKIPAWGFYFPVTAEPEPEPDPGDKAMLSLKGDANEAFTLDFYEDGTYHFEFTTHKAGEDGTWAMTDGKLTLTCQDRVNVFEQNEDGSYTVNYISKKSEQMTQHYTMSAEQYSLFSGVLLSLKGDANEAFTLDFYEDGTYHFEFTTYHAAEDGTWALVGGKLTLTCQDRVNTFEKNEDGSYTVNYISQKSEQMTQHYTISAEQFKLFSNQTLSLKGDANEAFTLDFFEGGTYHFEFTTYHAAEDGTWALVGGKLTLICQDRVNTFEKNEDGSYTVNYISQKSEQMTQHFTISAEDYKANFQKVLLGLKGDANQAFVLDLREDGTYFFEFTTYHASEEGTWSFANGKLTLTCQDRVNTFEKNEDGSYTVNYISQKSEQMTQHFTISAEDYKANFQGTLVSLKGNANEAFILEFYADGTYYFSFTTYNASENGTWAVVDGKLTLTCLERVNVFEQNEGGSYTVNYISQKSAQMTQHYTLSAEQYAALVK